ncbi:MAG: Hsp20/alpha crystallin family protein [Halobacteriaceae archaeon]
MTNFARSIGNAFMKRVGRVAGRFQEQRPIKTDLLESEDEYLVVFDTPGATASDIEVRYRGGAVTVQVDRFRDYHEGFSMRFPGRGLALDGKRRLPGNAVVNAEAASARLNPDGTLYVFLPKESPGFSDSGTETFSDPDDDWAEPPADETSESPAETTNESHSDGGPKRVVRRIDE